jgi:hypothetical protein
MKIASVLSIIAAVSSLALAMSAQTTQFPNELDGYQFFGSGKLKGLQLLSSTREDVKRVFGQSCENQCDYDDNWTVNFGYFDEGWTREESNNRGDRRVYKLDPKYIGKLRQIDLKPKKAVSFANISFPSAFSRTIVRAAPDPNDPRAGAAATVYDTFGDPNGLSYQIFAPANPPPLPGSRMFKPGELMLIRYTIPKEREKSLFILEK